MTPQERLAWAHARLDEYLREHDVQAFNDALDATLEAVEHLANCDGTDRTCADITDECEGGDDCKHCATDCQECVYYRKGSLYQRPMLDLLDELNKYAERVA